MCVLHVAAQEDLYGFAVIEMVSKEIDVNENTIYPILRRLTEQGYLRTYLEPTKMGAPRKYYSITDEGKNRLVEQETEWKQFINGVYKLLGGSSHES